MAPEQVEGEEADARTDIFAFGAVVYEMATGKKAFEGKSQASLIAAIMEREPPAMSSLQPLTPPQLDRVVKKCLAKEPEKRWQSASDLTDALKWIAEGGSQAGIRESVVARRKTRERLLATVAAIAVVVAVLALAFLYLRRVPQDARAVRFFISPPDTWTLSLESFSGGAATGSLAVSPDGQRVAFVAINADGRSLLWLRSLDAPSAQGLPGTDGAAPSPFWSPDSRFLGFFADGKLKKIDITGGPPIALCDALNSYGGSWSPDGVIVFATANVALQRVSALGGAPMPATTLGQGETWQGRPSFLPDGRHFLYPAATGVGRRSIYVGSLDSNERKLLLITDAASALYSQGHLLFLRERTLMAQPFDTRHLALTGEALPIAEQIETQTPAAPYGVFSASENGVLAYRTGTGLASLQLVWFDRVGKQIGVLGDSAAYSDVELSPDGTRASVSIRGQAPNGRDIWLYDVARSLRTRFTFDQADDFASVWSPDSSRVVFNSRRKGHYDLYQKASNGAGTEEVLLEDGLDKYPSGWSPDGRFILYRSTGESTGLDLFVLPLSGDRKPFPFLRTKFNEQHGQFSPDGRWVAYSSDESGKIEVYVAPFPGPGGKWQVSNGGGSYPRWRRDGTELFYLAPDNKLMAAEVNGKGASFEIDTIKPLFETRALLGPYGVSADGQRFLINTLSEQTAAAPITVVLNWTAGLKK